jgi:chromosome partitioning protein
MKTVVISNRKGGSAKTTTSVNLAATLATQGFSVLLIDFDTQGHASIGVGAKGVDANGSHSIFLGHTLSESFLPTVVEDLTLSPALEMFDVYEYADLRGVLKNRFRKESIPDFFDFCIIDTPPTYDAILKNSLEVADAVIIPVVPHHLGVVGVGQMIRAIYQMGMDGGNKIELVKALPVMYNPHIKEHKDAIKSIADSFGSDKLFSPIGIDINLAKQFEIKKPVVLADRRKKGAKDYKKFAKELLDAFNIRPNSNLFSASR